MKIGLISRWHVHANEYAHHVQKFPGAEINAVWDESRARGSQWAKELNCRYYGDYSSFLSSDIDAVVVASPTSMHPHLLVKAAQAGKHIFCEKALTITYTDALRVKKAIEENHVNFAISFPHKSRPELLYAKEAIESGRLGRITYARVRNVHNGAVADWLPSYFYDPALCGGGAMIDLGAHPMYTLPWLLGRPLFVQSQFSDFTHRGVEDNAVSMIEFESGAVGISETGFVSPFDPYTLEISGTEGYLCVRGNQVELADSSTGGKLSCVTNMPDAKPSPIVQWLGWCNGTGEKPEGILIEDAVALVSLTYAAYQAFRTGDKTYVTV